MGNPPFEDVSPIKNGRFPLLLVSLPEGNRQIASFPQVHPEHKKHICESTTQSIFGEKMLHQFIYERTNGTIPKKRSQSEQKHKANGILEHMSPTIKGIQHLQLSLLRLF